MFINYIMLINNFLLRVYKVLYLYNFLFSRLQEPNSEICNLSPAQDTIPASPLKTMEVVPQPYPGCRFCLAIVEDDESAPALPRTPFMLFHGPPCKVENTPKPLRR